MHRTTETPPMLVNDFCRNRLIQAFLIGLLLILSSQQHALGGVTYSTQHGAIRVNASTFFVSTGNIPRQHDFGPTGGFVDSLSGVPRLATILAGNSFYRNTLISGSAISQAGIPGRVEWTPSAVITANEIGDGLPGEPCRAQASSYPIAPDIPLVWKLRFQLGEKIAGREWQLLPSGFDPALLWQLKAPNLQPALAMIADTDLADPTRLMLSFSLLSGTSNKIRNVATIHGLATATPINVRIEAILDERENFDGGQGSWRVFVNGQLAVDHSGPTLTQFASEPHQWFFGLYRYLAMGPSNISRIVRWEKLVLENGAVRSESRP